MKSKRQAAIIRLIQQEKVHSQEQLRELLKAKGQDVTQATLSRDLRDLRLVKVTDADGESFYAQPSDAPSRVPTVTQLAATLIRSVEGTGPLLVARTPPGSAEALGGSLDFEGWEEILGTIAGDDTLLIIARSESERITVQNRLAELAGI
ncbi:MAG: arginine repressor [Gemmatimonadota bacterium]|nr:arginine repressor [Gemmatimonadota bacterium]